MYDHILYHELIFDSIYVWFLHALNVLQARQRKGKLFADLQEEKQTDFTFPQADKIK